MFLIARNLRHWECSAALLLLLAPVSRAADVTADPAEAFRNRPLSEKLGTPRQTLETLCFAMDAYDKIPSMIADAVACLEVDAKDGYAPGAIELLAIQMNEILDELSIPFTGVGSGSDGKPVVFYEREEIKIVLACGADRLWRFDRATVARIPTMRMSLVARTKQRNSIRAQLQEGMEEPTATAVTFLEHAIEGDYESAALRLDLSQVPADQRPARGPLLAWKLACVIQRRCYVFRQAVPIEPEGPPFTLSADAVGRIVIERVRKPNGKDTWLFAAATVAAIDTMYQAEQKKRPDPRYVLLKTVVSLPPEPRAATEDMVKGTKAPSNVPPEFSSPRTLLREFFRAMDDAEYNDAKLLAAPRFIDLSHLADDDLKTRGPKLATMLETVFRKLKLDLSAVPDKWSAPPQVLSGPDGLRVEIVRQTDGCWRFSRETASRLPAMYDSISSKDKTEQERTYGLNNPRETLITFFRSVNNRDGRQATTCLDLSEFPTSARDDLGPVLAFKLKNVIDHIGRVYLQEIPNDPDGPRFVLYRGTYGRITLARREEDKSRSWRFTTSTVRQIESMFEQLLDAPLDSSLASESHIRLTPAFLTEPGIWIHRRISPLFRHPVLGLELYQWAGLPLIVLGSWLVAAVAGKVLYWLLIWIFHIGAAQADRDLIRARLGAYRFLVFLFCLHYLLEWVDLPVSFGTLLYGFEKFVFTAALVWAGFQWTDLGYLFYHHSGEMNNHRGLGDLLVPFTVRAVKVTVVLIALAYLVYLFGEGESLKQFLTGLGVAGLAVSLAAQDSLKNLFATLLLIGDRTFRVGDRLLIGDKEGVVEQVGFRSTKLRTPEDSLLILPNSLMAYGVVDNLGLRQYRRIRMVFSLPLDTPLEKAATLRDQVRNYLLAYPGVDRKRVHAHFNRISETGIEIETSAYVNAIDFEAEKQCREDFLRESLRLAGALNVTMLPNKK